MTPPTDKDGGQRFRVIALAIVALVIVAIGVVLLTDGNDDGTGAADTTSSPTTPTSDPLPDTVPATEPSASDPATTDPTTTDPTTTTESPTTTAPDGDTSPAIWPWVESSTRFTDPVDAATSYATDFLGFTDPLIGEFQAGDNRSGEVEIRPGDPGPLTVVFVRQLTADDSWWVLASVAENIRVDEPESGDTVTSPLSLSGSARAFEGTVEVEVRVDGSDEAIGVGFVTGSGGPEAGPFEGTVEFDAPGTGGGAVVFISRSPEDGRVLEATALPVNFE